MKRHAASLLSLAVSVAACAAALPALAEGGSALRVQIFPAGQFRPEGTLAAGAVPDCGYWFIDAAAAAQVIARARSRAMQICVDYEHQMLHAKTNGQPAPAAAWIDAASLEWVEGEGLFATAALTQRAREAVVADEIRYFSPVFIFDKTDGTVLDLKLGALTNLPAIDGMQPLAAAAESLFAADLAALSQQLSATQPTEDSHMEKLLKLLQWLLNKPDGTADELGEQLDTIKSQLTPEAQAAASFDLVAHLAGQGTQLAALSQQVVAAGTPDPAKFVPIEVMRGMQAENTSLSQQLAALSQQTGQVGIESLVDKAIADNKLRSYQRDWALDLGRKDLAALNQFIAEAPAIAALAARQSDVVKPAEVATGQALDDVSLAVCSQLGLSPAEYAKGKL